MANTRQLSKQNVVAPVVPVDATLDADFNIEVAEAELDALIKRLKKRLKHIEAVTPLWDDGTKYHQGTAIQCRNNARGKFKQVITRWMKIPYFEEGMSAGQVAALQADIEFMTHVAGLYEHWDWLKDENPA